MSSGLITGGGGADERLLAADGAGGWSAESSTADRSPPAGSAVWPEQPAARIDTPHSAAEKHFHRNFMRSYRRGRDDTGAKKKPECPATLRRVLQAGHGRILVLANHLSIIASTQADPGPIINVLTDEFHRAVSKTDLGTTSVPAGGTHHR
jgi:hypothetical protein